MSTTIESRRALARAHAWPDSHSPSETVSIIGITESGAVPLVSEVSAEGAVVRAPEWHADRDARALEDQFRAETGYVPRELVVMSAVSPVVVLAPGLSRCGERPRGLELVPLGELPQWLQERKAHGDAVDPKLWFAALLAERRFPHWARERVETALRSLQAAASARSLAMPVLLRH